MCDKRCILLCILHLKPVQYSMVTAYRLHSPENTSVVYTPTMWYDSVPFPTHIFGTLVHSILTNYFNFSLTLTAWSQHHCRCIACERCVKIGLQLLLFDSFIFCVILTVTLHTYCLLGLFVYCLFVCLFCCVRYYSRLPCLLCYSSHYAYYTSINLLFT